MTALADTRFSRAPRNGCSGCRSDFRSVSLFDAHRIGSYAYPWSPEQEDGRRCLGEEEMTELGWEQEDDGRWFDPVSAQRARDAFRGPSALGREPRSPSEASDDLEVQ